MKMQLLVVGCVLLIWCQRVAAENIEHSPIVEQDYHEPSELEIAKARDLLTNLEVNQSLLERYAHLCTGTLMLRSGPEFFVALHAVDHNLDAERHIVRREFTDKSDPILLTNPAGADGYGDSTVTGPTFLPTGSDKLRLKGMIYVSNKPEEAISTNAIKFFGIDRNFNPITSSLIPLSSFFEGKTSKGSVADLFVIEKFTPDKVAVRKDHFFLQSQLKYSDGSPSGISSYIEFSNDLPVRYELWKTLGQKRSVLFSTSTEWERLREIDVPRRLEAVQYMPNYQQSLHAEFRWKLGDAVPTRLFSLSDVTEANALDW